MISLLLFFLTGCSADNGRVEVGALIFEESFEVVDPDAWIVESEDSVSLRDCLGGGMLTLNVPKGITVWNTKRFEGDVMYEFAVTVVDRGGANDRVSDLNCFWMATDPSYPNDFFRRSRWRGGKFWHYYTLNLYYVGYGGHDNTLTRMRRYDASLKPPPPVLSEYDDPAHLITANRVNVVRIICYKGTTSYWFNGKKLFELQDPDPYTSGYFGFRTTGNHMKVDYFKVFSLERSHDDDGVDKRPDGSVDRRR